MVNCLSKHDELVSCIKRCLSAWEPNVAVQRLQLASVLHQQNEQSDATALLAEGRTDRPLLRLTVLLHRSSKGRP